MRDVEGRSLANCSVPPLVLLVLLDELLDGAERVARLVLEVLGEDDVVLHSLLLLFGSDDMASVTLVLGMR